MSVRPDRVSRIVSAAASVNATSAKAGPAQLFAITGYNAANAVRYLKLYNRATAPTVGTHTPLMTLALPATAAFSYSFPVPIEFSLGLAYGLTTGAADNDTAALTSADVVGLNIIYT